MVVDPGVSPFAIGDLLTEEQYQEALDEHGEDAFLAGMGAEAVRELLRQIERGPNGDGNGIPWLATELRRDLAESTSEAKRKKIIRRLKVVEAFRTLVAIRPKS